MAGGDLVDHFLQPVEIGLGAFQAQLGLMAAGAQTGHAGGLFQDAATVLRLGGDQFGNLALADEGGRIGARTGIHEEELDILGPHFLAIDLVGGTGAAGDAPCDVERVGVVETGRGELVGIVDREHDFGKIAGRAGIGTGEDHVFHAVTAQGFGRGRAHHPAQGLKQIRLAATVGSDHAC